jgi:hypothetical protein
MSVRTEAPHDNRIVEPARAPQAGDTIAPPTPSRVLQFTPGVDWHEGS